MRPDLPMGWTFMGSIVRILIAIWFSIVASMRTSGVSTTPQPLMGPEDLARLLGVPVATLYAWKHRSLGPPALKVGRHLRWRPEDVNRWLEDQAAAR